MRPRGAACQAARRLSTGAARGHPMTLSIPRIAEIIGAAPPRATGTVSGWSIDSRTLNPGDCFIALSGPMHDGHAFLPQVFEHGASVAIVERPNPTTQGEQL